MAEKIFVQSGTRPDRYYQIYYSEILRSMACTCPDFCFRRANTKTPDCKHIMMIKEMVRNDDSKRQG